MAVILSTRLDPISIKKYLVIHVETRIIWTLSRILHK